jgi:hypothetical protein
MGLTDVPEALLSRDCTFSDGNRLTMNARERTRKLALSVDADWGRVHLRLSDSFCVHRYNTVYRSSLFCYCSFLEMARRRRLLGMARSCWQGHLNRRALAVRASAALTAR